MFLTIAYFALCAASIGYLFWLNIKSHREIDKNLKALNEQNERILKLLKRK